MPPPSGGIRDQIVLDAEAIRDAPSPGERIGLGVADITEGVKQKFLNWTDPAAAAQFTQEKNQERATYDAARSAEAKALGQDKPGFDWWRMGGTAGLASPLALVPGGQSLLARSAIGAAQGAPLAYSTFNRSNDPTQNFLQGLGGGVLGGAMNVAAPYVVGGAVQLGQGAMNLGRQGVNAVRGWLTPQSQVADTLRTTLLKTGVDFDSLSTAAQQAMQAEAQAQMRAGGQLNAEQLLRNADIEAIAGPGSALRGQVTRSPVDWSIERNLQRTEANLPSVRGGAQETITGRLQQQDQALKTFSKRIGQDVHGEELYGGVSSAGPAQTAPQASQRAIDAVRATDAGRQRVVNELYKAYRETGMKDAAVPESRLMESLTKIIDENGQENIPLAVQSRLKEFGFLGGERTRQLTVQQADLFNRLLNNNNPGHGPQSLVVGELRSALNRSLLDVAPEASQATQALVTARKAASEMFAAREAGRGVEQAIEGVAPDRFLQQNVLGGTVRDLQALKDNLVRGSEPSAWNDLRSQAWQQIHDAVTQGGRSQFSGARLDDILRQIGKERLEVLFTGPEMQAINTLRRGSLNMTFQPPFSAVNYSNSAPTLMAQALRLGNRIPGVNLFTQPIQHEMENAATQGLLNQALSGARGASNAGVLEAQAAARAALERQLLAQRGYAGLLGAAGPPGVTTQMRR